MFLFQSTYRLFFVLVIPVIVNIFFVLTCNTESSEATPISLLTTADKMFSLKTTLTWQELDRCPRIISFKKKKWVWTALITIRSKQAMKLQQINFQWSGEKIVMLHASLYRKAHQNQELIPIQDNLVCDGTWNSTKQQITFCLNEKVVAVNEYYLVLSIPKASVKKLRHGQFTLARSEPLKMVSL